MSWQSAWATSRASSAPRRVGLMPTTVAPASAAPPRRKRYSGTFSRSTPTWNGPSPAQGLEHACPGRALRHDLAPGPRRVLEAQAGVVVLGTRQDQLGHRRHRPDDSLMTPMGISEPRDLDALRDGLTRWVAVMAARRARRRPRPSGPTRHRDCRARRSSWSSTGPSGPAWDSAGASTRRGSCACPPTARDCSLPTTSACRAGCRRVLAGAGVAGGGPRSPSRRTTAGWVRPSCSCPVWRAGWCAPTSPTCARDGWPTPRPTGQAKLHGEIVDALARIHRLDWESLGCGAILGAHRIAA